MRIISETRLKRFWQANPQQARSRKSLIQWLAQSKAAAWKSPADVKRTFGKNVDFVQSDNGSRLAVFNVYANHYRLIAAVHYLAGHPIKGRVYVLQILTHEEYDENRWKQEL
ncbi:MAG: type II toxin-antitoxin system HigB family toxin [Tepidisphaeraceae bacterium]